MSDPTPLAFSYVRFSNPEQRTGDSVRRQDEARAAWLARHPAVRLDASLAFREEGKSAFRGKHRLNPDRDALAAFLRHVEAGRVPRGSYLLIENLDRLSREEEVPACHLLTGILMAGVQVVQLSPYEMALTDKSNGWELMRAVMELSRGHGESALKSERVGEAWKEKKRRRRAGLPQNPSRNRRMNGNEAFTTRRLPAWIEARDDGTLALIPDRAAVIRRIFHLAANGYGLAAIVRTFTQENVPPFGERVLKPGAKRPAYSGHWTRSYIGLILADHRALGQFQPRRRDGEPDGEVIPNYFPAAVSPADWDAARAGARQRKNRPGRLGTLVNVFAGLVKNALGGDSFSTATRTERDGRRHRVLINTDGAEGRSSCRTFPLETFEEAVVRLLDEMDPAGVIGADDGSALARSLAEQLADAKSELAEATALLHVRVSRALADRVADLEDAVADLTRRSNEARQEAAHPLSEAWGEGKAMLRAEFLKTQDGRLRLRAFLRRVIDSVWMIVVPKGRDRLAFVQVHFAEDGCRDFLIGHRPPKANASGRTPPDRWYRSLPPEAPKRLDLRKREDARELADDLAGVPWNDSAEGATHF